MPSTQQTDKKDECGLGAALSVISGKWKSIIIWELHFQPLRFGALKRSIAGISEKILFEQLRQLEEADIVQRNVLSIKPLQVEYSLTDTGQTLNEAVHTLAEWGKAYKTHRNS